MSYQETYSRHQLERLAHAASRYGYLSSLENPTPLQRVERSMLFTKLIVDWNLDPMELAQPYEDEDQSKERGITSQR